MRKLGTGTDGSRGRTRVVRALAGTLLAVGLAVPFVGADAARPNGWGHDHGNGHGDDAGKLLFFASDGMRQDAVEQYADEGVVPGFRDLLRHGANASDNGLLTQAPPNTGAGWFTLTTGAWPGVHGSTNNTFHINGAAVRATRRRRSRPPASCRPRRSPRRPSAAARRSPRSSGPAAAAARSTARRSTSATSAPAAAWRRTTSSPTDSPTFTAAFGLQFDHPAGFAGQPPFPQAAPTPATGWTNVPTLVQPGEGDAPARARRQQSTSTASTPTSTTAATTTGRATTACCSRAPRTATTRSPTSRKASGPTSRSRSRHARTRPTRSNGKTGAFLVKVERLERRPLAGAAVPHVGDARDRDLADLAGRARLHRQLRGLRRRALPVLAGRRLRRARGRDRQRGDLRRAGRVLGDRLPPADQVRARHVQAGPGAGRLPGHRRGPAPVPRARHQEAAERRQEPGLRRHRGQRHARRSRQAARGVHPRGLRGLRRDDAARPGAHARPRPDHVRVVRPRLRAAVRGDRRQQGARRPRPAVAGRRRRTAARRPARRSARRRPAGPAARAQIYLNLAGRDPVRRRRRVPAGPGGRRGRRRSRRSRPPSWPSRTPTTGPATASPRAGR